jgi:hypothetical protein
MNLKAHGRAERADLAALLAAWPEAHRGSATGTVRVSREPSGSYLYGRPRFRGSEGGGELACTPEYVTGFALTCGNTLIGSLTCDNRVGRHWRVLEVFGPLAD